MMLRDYLQTIAKSYDRNDAFSSPVQKQLRNAREHLLNHAPAYYAIEGSGGKGKQTLTPWIGFFDLDETDSPEHGIYVVYLFSEDLSRVMLSLNQGITSLTKRLGMPGARSQLRKEADTIRAALTEAELEGLSPSLGLASKGWRQSAYEAGNIAARTYDTAGLPQEDTLQGDLKRFLTLYQRALEEKARILQAKPGLINSSSGAAPSSRVPDPEANFIPKSSNDYIQHFTGKKLIKTRSHEALLNEFVKFARAQGFTPSSPHPQDLVLRRQNLVWLLEAKVVKNGKASGAVRECIGQLFMYRKFWYPQPPPPTLVGLFSADIGALYREFLTSLGIGTVWSEDGRWLGSPMAFAAGIAEASAS